MDLSRNGQSHVGFAHRVRKALRTGAKGARPKLVANLVLWGFAWMVFIGLCKLLAPNLSPLPSLAADAVGWPLLALQILAVVIIFMIVYVAGGAVSLAKRILTRRPSGPSGPSVPARAQGFAEIILFEGVDALVTLASANAALAVLSIFIDILPPIDRLVALAAGAVGYFFSLLILGKHFEEQSNAPKNAEGGD